MFGEDFDLSKIEISKIKQLGFLQSKGEDYMEVNGNSQG